MDMRIVTQDTFGGPEVLKIVNRPTPEPGEGEVLVRVGATGVNPIDIAVRDGSHPLLGDPPFTLGWDVAGTVEALGPDVTTLAVGDRVMGMPRFHDEASGYADAVVAPAADLTRTPEGLSDIEAAALPLVGLTAYQALVEVADVGPGTRVLVLAAGGGVGHVAVQLAVARGAYVVATASARKAEFVRGLGADEVVDYATADVSDIDPVDVLLDPLGGAGTADLVPLVKPGGVLALLVGQFDAATTAAAQHAGIRLARIGVVPNHTSLAAVASLAREGLLRPVVAETFPLDQVGAAHVAQGEAPAGKIVLVP